MISLVVWLGFKSAIDPSYVPWFGIASAFLAPMGLTIATFGIRRGRLDLVESLMKVPEINRLANEAKSKEEELRLLKTERAQLHEIIASESKRQMLEARKAAIENEAKRLLNEYTVLEEELGRINQTQKGSELVSKSIEDLRKIVKGRLDGDIILNLRGRVLVLPREMLLSLPMGGFTYHYLRFLDQLLEQIPKHSKESKNRPKGDK